MKKVIEVATPKVDDREEMFVNGLLTVDSTANGFNARKYTRDEITDMSSGVRKQWDNGEDAMHNAPVREKIHMFKSLVCYKI